MNDEFNRQPYVNNDAKELEEVAERQAYGENPRAEEFQNYEAQPEKKPRSKSLGRLTAALSAAAAALVFAVVLAPALAGGKTAVDFAEVWSTDTTISYSIYLENFSDGLQVVVYNDFTERSQAVEGERVNGEATGLKPNVVYKIAVKKGSRSIAETSLRTKKIEEMPKTEFYSVTHECTCNVDGLFRFKMDFIDENGYWYDFRASLTDAFGNVSQCEFTDDLRGEQTIAVTDADLRGSSARFVIACTSYKEGAAEVILYDTTVQI